MYFITLKSLLVTVVAITLFQVFLIYIKASPEQRLYLWKDALLCNNF